MNTTCYGKISPHRINCLLPRQTPTAAVLKHFRENMLVAQTAAIHEAAHAVAYTVLGALVEEICLISPYGLGFAAHTALRSSITLEQRSIGALAGVVMSSFLWEDCTGHINSDACTAFEAAIRLKGVTGPNIDLDDINAALKRMHADWIQAMKLVTRPRNFLAIQRVAKHALKCETLAGTIVRSIVANTKGHPTPTTLKQLRVIRQRRMESGPPYMRALEDYLAETCPAVKLSSEARHSWLSSRGAVAQKLTLGRINNPG